MIGAVTEIVLSAPSVAACGGAAGLILEVVLSSNPLISIPVPVLLAADLGMGCAADACCEPRIAAVPPLMFNSERGSVVAVPCILFCKAIPVRPRPGN